MKNRRSSPRFPASDERIWVGRWLDHGRFELQAACVENISLGGVKITASMNLTKGQSIWLCPGNTACRECIEATVLDVETHDKTNVIARLRFVEPCHEEIMKTLLGSIPAPHFKIACRESHGSPENKKRQSLTRRG